MNKYAIITDTHFGGKQDSEIFQKHIERFFKEVFFPYLKKNNIKHIIHLGDVFDKRKSINFKSLTHFYRVFLKEIIENDYELIMITGNHDCFYTNTNKLNSLDSLVDEESSSNIKIFSECEEYDGILLVPWINQENQELTFKKIKSSKSKYCFGHLEVEGFSMYKGYESKGGISRKIFNKFDMVLSGHYHTKSNKGNITYLGAPYEITWSDWNDPRGFHVFEDGKLEYIQNHINLFEKIYYNDKKYDYKDLKVEDYENKYVKVVVSEKTDSDCFDNVISKLNSCEIADLKIDEDYSFDSDVEFNEEDIQNTLQILEEYVDCMDLENDDKSDLKDIIKELYTESLETE